MIGVFGYLTWRSAHNRIVRQLQRLRSPRYLAALLLGLGYLWFIVIAQRPTTSAAAVPDARAVELIGALALFGAVAWGWIFGVERRVLAFSPAEVTFLFSGPVSRQGLVQFKLLRSQLLILFNALLWTLILSRERFGVSSWLRVVSIWVMLTTLSFHRLGASFVRTSLAEHGRLGAKHRAVSLAVVGAFLIAVVWSIADALPQLTVAREGDVRSLLGAAAQAFERPIPHLLTYPFRIMVRPLAARTVGEWLTALWPALLLMVLHYIWVVRSDTAFEEAAAEVSLRRVAALSVSGASSRTPARSRQAFIRLSPHGWPAGAILWKNLVAATRTRRVRNAAMSLLAAGVVVGALSFDPEGGVAEAAGWLALLWAALTVVTGPQYVRNDLRGDLLKLDLLRSYPVRGWSVVLAEALASTLLLSVIQLALLTIGYLAFLGNQSIEPGLGERTLLLVACTIFLPAINLLSMLIQNGAALLYPAWVKLGGTRGTGVEALGQNLLMVIAFLLILLFILLLPAVIGGGIYLLLRAPLGDWALLPSGIVALAIMGFEAGWLVDWLGRVFERTDPATAGILV
jgi:ABC-2 type transport system permease protein